MRGLKPFPSALLVLMLATAMHPLFARADGPAEDILETVSTGTTQWSDANTWDQGRRPCAAESARFVSNGATDDVFVEVNTDYTPRVSGLRFGSSGIFLRIKPNSGINITHPSRVETPPCPRIDGLEAAMLAPKIAQVSWEDNDANKEMAVTVGGRNAPVDEEDSNAIIRLSEDEAQGNSDSNIEFVVTATGEQGTEDAQRTISIPSELYKQATWRRPESGAWISSNKWTLGRPPCGKDHAVFADSNGGSYNVVLNETTRFKSLTLRPGGVLVLRGPGAGIKLTKSTDPSYDESIDDDVCAAPQYTTFAPVITSPPTSTSATAGATGASDSSTTTAQNPSSSTGQVSPSPSPISVTAGGGSTATGPGGDGSNPTAPSPTSGPGTSPTDASATPSAGPTAGVSTTTEALGGSRGSGGAPIAAIAGAAAGVVVVIVIIIVVVILVRRRNDDQSKGSVYGGAPLGINEGELMPMAVNTLTNDGGLAVDRNAIVLGKSLGSGVFGRVREAKLRDKNGNSSTVAVRVQRNQMEARMFDAFVAEIAVLRRVGRSAHPNLCCIVGLCTDRQPYYVVMPYFSTGSLRSFLRDSRGSSTMQQTLQQTDLLTMMRQCADAVLYLHGVSVTHNCLSASCVLLTADNECKVSDFGRDPFQYPDKEIRRWLAPEVLLSRTYSPSADVWSFGVFAWEVITLGATPYIDVQPIQLAPHLEAGNRPLRPDNCPSPVYEIMELCWQQRATNRCTLRVAVAKLDKLIKAGLPEPPTTKYLPYIEERREAWSIAAKDWDPATYDISNNGGGAGGNPYAQPDAGGYSSTYARPGGPGYSQPYVAGDSTYSSVASSGRAPPRLSAASGLSDWDSSTYAIGKPQGGTQGWDSGHYDIGSGKKLSNDLSESTL